MGKIFYLLAPIKDSSTFSPGEKNKIQIEVKKYFGYQKNYKICFLDKLQIFLSSFSLPVHYLIGGHWGLVWVVRLLLVVYIFNSWLLIHMLYK